MDQVGRFLVYDWVYFAKAFGFVRVPPVLTLLQFLFLMGVRGWAWASGGYVGQRIQALPAGRFSDFGKRVNDFRAVVGGRALGAASSFDKMQGKLIGPLV